MINPNDPEENPDLVSDGSDSGQPPRSREEPTVPKPTKPAHERQKSREGSDLRQFTDSPARNENMNRRAGNDPVPQRYAGRGVGRQGPQSIGSENSFEKSPLHPKARVLGRGPGGAPSPSWEGGKVPFESSHGTPGRSRLRPKGDESVSAPLLFKVLALHMINMIFQMTLALVYLFVWQPDNGAAVPKFGSGTRVTLHRLMGILIYSTK